MTIEESIRKLNGLIDEVHKRIDSVNEDRQKQRNQNSTYRQGLADSITELEKSLAKQIERIDNSVHCDVADNLKDNIDSIKQQIEVNVDCTNKDVAEFREGFTRVNADINILNDDMSTTVRRLNAIVDQWKGFRGIFDDGIAGIGNQYKEISDNIVSINGSINALADENIAQASQAGRVNGRVNSLMDSVGALALQLTANRDSTDTRFKKLGDSVNARFKNNGDFVRTLNGRLEKMEKAFFGVVPDPDVNAFKRQCESPIIHGDPSADPTPDEGGLDQRPIADIADIDANKATEFHDNILKGMQEAKIPVTAKVDDMNFTQTPDGWTVTFTMPFDSKCPSVGKDEDDES